MEKVYLHAVVVKKPTPLALARLKAQRIIKNKNKTFYTETEDSFRFRNLPERYFKDLTTKVIDDEISIITGHAKDEPSVPVKVEEKEREES
jgi:hypothetical protein